MSDASSNLGKAYDPKPIEDKWYAWWIEHRLFEGNADAERNPFSIVIPPPNVTGSLHMGHALNNTLQDIQCRYKRMNGYDVLWLPGTDHAGIATQNVVERNLAAQGISRHELGREAFVDKVWEWKEQYGNRIVNQLKKLGASCDWRRERFTMDEGLSRAVHAGSICSVEPSYQQDGINAPKGKILYGHGFHRSSQQFLHMPDHGATLVDFFEVDGGSDKSVFHHINGHDGFNRAAGGHCVSDITF